MYAIIRSGGKQAKVHEGDVIDVERLHVDGEVTFTPLLVVDDKGKVFSGRDQLKTAKVTAKVVGESAGDKVDMFKYKAKTGYRRRGGHRQKYTTIEVTKIEAPKKASTKAASAEAAPADPEAMESAAAQAVVEAAAPKAPARKPAAKKES